MAGTRLLLDRFCGTFSLPVEVEAHLSIPDEEPGRRQNQGYHSFRASVKIAAEAWV